jgi:glycosyltransferase involved in cell wall biosynthesis
MAENQTLAAAPDATSRLLVQDAPGHRSPDVRKRIVYVQYTNPAGFPPLQHSSQILAEQGWEVLFLGALIAGTETFVFPRRPRIEVRQMGIRPTGWRQKLHYLWFCAWCLVWILRRRPDWIYVSDLLACPVGVVAGALGVPTVLHEHDSPDDSTPGRFIRMCLWARQKCARRARMCILPNALRAARFAQQTRIATTPLVVWNCPRREEATILRTSRQGHVKFFYHGSIVAERLPLCVVDALANLPDGSVLTVVGYETAGSGGHVQALRDRARALGISDRLNLVGPLARREDVLEACRQHDAGLAFMPFHSSDINLQAMTGASNKPFDYLASGLALVVSKLPDWEEVFVNPGYGIACDPGSAKSVASAFEWLGSNREAMRAMGERGRQKILNDWNYEAQFAPAIRQMAGTVQS